MKHGDVIGHYSRKAEEARNAGDPEGEVEAYGCILQAFEIDPDPSPDGCVALHLVCRVLADLTNEPPHPWEAQVAADRAKALRNRVCGVPH